MSWEQEKPTYEEYANASDWARFKYKYGIIVMVLAWACLLFIAIYMVVNGEAIARHPLIYGADKYNVTCICRRGSTTLHVNQTTMEVQTTFVGEVPKINITEIENGKTRGVKDSEES